MQLNDISIFAKNLVALRQHHPALEARITLASPARLAGDIPVVPEQGRKGQLTLKAEDSIGMFYLHSTYDPEKEAEEYARQELTDSNINVVVVAGFGLGYLVRALCRLCNVQTRIAVVEPRLDLFISALSSLDVSDMLADERIRFIVAQDIKIAVKETIAELSPEKLKGWKLIASPPQMRLHKNFLQSFVDQLGSSINVQISSLTTSFNLSELFLRNTLSNLGIAANSPGVIHFKDCWKDRPALIVAAGPSLNKQLPQLREVQDKFLIIAAEKTWSILQKAGIKAHIVVAIDPRSPPAWEIEPPDDVWFLVASSCNPVTVKSKSGRHVVSFATPSHEEILKPMIGERGCLPSGGSVANNAFSFAKLMGAAPVILIGQDLAYTGGVSHATGYFDMKSLDNIKVAQKDNGYREIEGYWGDRVQTDRQLDSYRKWYEDYITLHPSEIVINATEGGAKIEGSVQMSFAQACQKYAEKTPVSIIDLWPSEKIYISPDSSSIDTKFNDLIEKIRKFQEIANDGVEIARKLSEKEIVKAGKKQDRLKKISNKLKSFDSSAKNFLDEFVRKQSFYAVRTVKLNDEENTDKNEMLMNYLESLVKGCDRAVLAISENRSETK